jgi:hypothetical protein
MITIRPGFRKPGTVISAVVVTGFCLVPVVLQPVSAGAVMGLVTLVVVYSLFWIMARQIRLEITETEVRARQRWARGRPDQEALRGEIRSIHYCPSRISFRGADGQPLMEPADIWTVREMVRAAEELQVPLYDHRGLLRLEELSEGRLAYDPASGPVTKAR